MQGFYKVSPIKQINARYLQVANHENMIAYKDYKYNKNKRSFYSRTKPQSLDIVEISSQGLHALQQHADSIPPTQIESATIPYISNLIANYEKWGST
ncbi:hypothetical protein [Pelosinus sp. UFO1]|uniref:hypothetical protein n=1 Tax=Pelosinus sp. UFO1 TaxID=484770 RepID=UPI0004D14E89|nr:hypothetical protein [Pelosinus sp. UFO1]AIF49726.1 hypothetical protein UFO1_0165 [Pelosinus sp. UFO1]